MEKGFVDEAGLKERGPITHALKLKVEYFLDYKQGKKTAEIRLDDRDYRIGDTLKLQSWMETKQEYTGSQIEKKIVGITRLYRVIPTVDYRWCVLHLGEP